MVNLRDVHVTVQRGRLSELFIQAADLFPTAHDKQGGKDCGDERELDFVVKLLKLLVDK